MPLRPTIIGGDAAPEPAPREERVEEPPRPSVLPAGQVQAPGFDIPSPVSLRPTTLDAGAQAGTAPPPEPVRRAAAMPASMPTSVRASVPDPVAVPLPIPGALPAAVPVPAPGPIVAATRVRGVERKGLVVDTALLAQRHEGASREALACAAAVLNGCVPEVATAVTLQQIGRDDQEAVGRIVEKVLAIVDEEAPRTVTRHVRRLLEILEDIDDALRPAALPWRKRALTEVIAAHRPEIDTLKAQCVRSEQRLMTLGQRLGDLEAESAGTMTRLAGAAIAAAEARAFFTDTRRLLALDEKEGDLLKSIALLQEQVLHIQRLESDFSALAQRVRDAVLHALPAWIAAATSATSTRLHDTDRYTLMEQLQSIVLALKTPH